MEKPAKLAQSSIQSMLVPNFLRGAEVFTSKINSVGSKKLELYALFWQKR